jgi:hypothetical protein
MATPTEMEFTISLVGDTTGEKWFGKFKARIRVPYRLQMMRDRLRREYLGEMPQYASARAQEQAIVFADLAVSLTEFPDWWKAAGNGQELCDDNLIEAIWSEVQRIQGAIKDEDKKKTQDDASALKKAVESGEASKPEKADEE